MFLHNLFLWWLRDPISYSTQHEVRWLYRVSHFCAARKKRRRCDGGVREIGYKRRNFPSPFRDRKKRFAGAMNGGAREFRVLVFEMAERLTAADCDSLRFIYGLPKRTAGPAAGLEILKTLNRQGVYCDARGLGEVLRTAHREDLAAEAEAFRPSTIPAAARQQSPTQLRGKCDAATAQAGSLAGELRRVCAAIPDSGLPRETLEKVSRELQEVEEALQVLFGRCEVMKRCFGSTVSDSTAPPQPRGELGEEGENRVPRPSRPIPVPRRRRVELSCDGSSPMPGPTRRSHPRSTDKKYLAAHHCRSFSCDGPAHCWVEQSTLSGRGGTSSEEHHRTSRPRHYHHHHNHFFLATSTLVTTCSPSLTRSCSDDKPRPPEKPGSYMKPNTNATWQEYNSFVN